MTETPQEYTQRILKQVDGEDGLKTQKATPAKLKKLIRGLTPKQLKWQSAPGKWSIAEILAHLADAEIAGSWRMRLIVQTNGVSVQPFDQDVWASVFQYKNRDAKMSLETFRALRENNLFMLKNLSPEHWENYGMHMERGKETVAHMVRMFAGHDKNHISQIEAIVAQLKKKKK